MHVQRYGTSFRVTKGISAEEQRRRAEARQAEIEELERNEPKADIGIDGAVKAFRAAATQLSVGEKAWIDGVPVMVTGEYKLYRVHNRDGEFLDSHGGRVDYQWGYACQYRNGEEVFFPAHQLTNENGARTHLRLTHCRPTQAMRPLMEFRERERM